LFSIILSLVIFVIVFVVKGVVMVSQSETVVIERLGKYHRTLGAGINFTIPLLDRRKLFVWKYTMEGPQGKYAVQKPLKTIDMRETVYDFPRQNVITRDNVVLEINGLLYFQITDPFRAVYEITNLPEAIEKLTQTTLRNVIGEKTLDETLSSRDDINARLCRVLDEATDKWGVKVNRVEIQDINPPEEIREAMQKEMRAERDRRAQVLVAEGAKRAAILNAEGFKESEINQAEGEKQARILRAEGIAQARVRESQAEAEAIKMISDAVKEANGDPTTYLIAFRYLETLKTMTDGDKAKTVYMPYEATAILGSLGVLKDLPGGEGLKNMLGEGATPKPE
jgi:regulator of protease activity HflC (stomatin/prohibitin superfamily)